MITKECESCGDLVDPATLKKDFLDELSCTNCRRQHSYLDLLQKGKVTEDQRKEFATASQKQLDKFLQTGKFDHTLTASLYDRLGI